MNVITKIFSERGKCWRRNLYFTTLSGEFRGIDRKRSDKIVSVWSENTTGIQWAQKTIKFWQNLRLLYVRAPQLRRLIIARQCCSARTDDAVTECGGGHNEAYRQRSDSLKRYGHVLLTFRRRVYFCTLPVVEKMLIYQTKLKVILKFKWLHFSLLITMK